MDILELMKENEKVGCFGVQYLDDKLRGILKGDLILIGARSGAGKSTIANMIALNNRDKGTKVALFSLENFKGDAFIEKAYYRYMEITRNYSLNLRDFASGDFKKDIEALKESESYAKKVLQNINIVSRQKGYGIEQLKEDMIKQVNDGCRLIILDHLDYVEKYSNSSENEHITELMRTIRGLQDAFKVAVIAVSHLRKPSNSKDSPVIPNENEFIGSSNKSKEATIVVMLAPDDEGNMDVIDKSKRLTWCCIRKLRMGGCDNTASKLIFNTRKGAYEPNYTEWKVNYSGTKTEMI